jgi:hypothetical protein
VPVPATALTRGGRSREARGLRAHAGEGFQDDVRVRDALAAERRIGHGDDAHAGRAGGVDARWRVLDREAPLRLDPQNSTSRSRR